ncbi:MAG TPA: histidinol-phosphate transaminase [Euryarchaeota archaeon]|nr:histidinol-phosphate transaminase [Euryarchaeota archaeon]
MTMSGKRRFVREDVLRIKEPSYRSLPDKTIKMNDNSNLFSINPIVRKIREQFDFESLSAYPSVSSDMLRNAVAGKNGVDPSQVIVGNGSDEIIDLVVKAFVDPGDAAVILSPSFEMYSRYLAVAGARIIESTLDAENFGIDVESIISSRAKIKFICSPNNPTGNAFSLTDIRRIAEESDSIVVVDEAYIEFALDQESAVGLVDELDNVIVLRTLSKAYGLAGLRIGYAVGGREPVGFVRRICAPFRLNRLSEWVATKAIESDDFVKKVAEMAKEERDWTSSALSSLGAVVYPSVTNFLLFKPPVPSAVLVASLMDMGIAIRDCGEKPLLDGCARVTLGPRKLNERFIDAVRTVTEDAS